jgi:hypothetical protein
MRVTWLAMGSGRNKTGISRKEWYFTTFSLWSSWISPQFTPKYLPEITHGQIIEGRCVTPQRSRLLRQWQLFEKYHQLNIYVSRELIKALRQGVSNVARENYMRFVIIDKMEDVWGSFLKIWKLFLIKHLLLWNWMRKVNGNYIATCDISHRDYRSFGIGGFGIQLSSVCTEPQFDMDRGV